jgi:diguanylate cyclase (GGDEF)-like protein
MTEATPDDYSILLVDDDPSVIAALGQVLRQFGKVRFARSGEEALRLAPEHPPDLVLLDIELPGMNGFETFTALKQVPGLADTPVLFITSHDDVELEVQGLSLGAADFITKPPRAGQVAARVRLQKRLQQMTAELRTAASTDPLTGLQNRRVFDEALSRGWAASQRVRSPLALLMIDVDYFKAYNDHYGHPAGDRCLQTIAHWLLQVVRRPADLVARYGGEEFAVLLPDTNAQGACRVAENVVQAVRSAGIEHAASVIARHVTISVGVSFSSPSEDSETLRMSLRRTPADFVAIADLALYAAKQAGRDHARILREEHMQFPERAVEVRSQLDVAP